MKFTKRLLVVLVTVWSFNFLASMGAGFAQVSEEIEISPTSDNNLPPFVTLVPSIEKSLEKFPGKIEQIQLAVKLVRDQIFHLHNGNFDEALIEWHENGEVLSLQPIMMSARQQLIKWPSVDSITVSAVDYIDALKKSRELVKESGTKLIPPKLHDGMWENPFGGLEVTVIQCSLGGVLISIDEPAFVDFGETSDIGLQGRIFNYQHVLFMVQTGLFIHEEIDPSTGLNKVDTVGRIHYMSIEPNLGRC
ncbi:MAG: hypothetical protein GWP38_07650 [Planctomycetia bacterium]|nr:hypothetical protein [Planctomycetia bacterium]